MSKGGPGSIPKRWLKCPRKTNGLVADKFLAFKTPLGPQFNDQVQEIYRFTPAMLISYTKSIQIKLGLWIDLTYTNRFYDKAEVEKAGCKYVKLKCRGHDETPTREQTTEFIKLVSKFVSQKPLEMIGVHCTHGFNRTGFLLVSYMVEQLDCSVEAAITEFARMRPPGIYKQDYLEELCRRYGDVEDTPIAPELPDWCLDEEEDVDDDVPCNSQSSSPSPQKKKNKRKKETTHKKDIFMPGVVSVEPFNDQPRFKQVQMKVQKFCKWEGTGFPGSQPVSMQRSNLENLHKKPYRVSWKADGVRFMMLIDGEDEVYMLDRDNCAFKVHNLKFFHKDDLSRHLTDTLLDGEMVIDEFKGIKTPRYLCYDIVTLDGTDVSNEDFYPTRLNHIEKDIVKPRIKAMEARIIIKEKEPFSVRLKPFWELPMARQLLGEKFAKQLLHEPDGLIFQPTKEPYVPGQCKDVLKWKPGDMNSVDFRLKIEMETGVGILSKKIGKLFVGNPEVFFATMKLTKNIRHLDNKIIECTYQNGEWQFMRERTDKSFANAYQTAEAVFKSIKDPVTKECLLEYIDNYRYRETTDMPPPSKRLRDH